MTDYKTCGQARFLSIFYSGGANPLKEWDTHVKDGHIKRFLDPELKVLVTDICGLNVSTTYISYPKGNKSSGIHFPFLVMIVKNLRRYFTFEITVLDDTGFKRRFRVSNFQSDTRVTCTSTAMPMILANGWNQIQFNLFDFTRRAYNRQFIEVVSLRINANIRLRRIYFTERLLSESELPAEYRLFYPLQKGTNRKSESAHVGDENIPPQFSKGILKTQDEVENLQKESLQSIGSSTKGLVKRQSQDSIRRSQHSIIKSQGLVTKSQESVIKSQDLSRKSQDSVRQGSDKISDQTKKSQESQPVIRINSRESQRSIGKDKQEQQENKTSKEHDFKQVFRMSSTTYRSQAASSSQVPSLGRTSHLTSPHVSRTTKDVDFFPNEAEDEKEEEIPLLSTNVEETNSPNEYSDKDQTTDHEEKRSVVFTNNGPN